MAFDMIGRCAYITHSNGLIARAGESIKPNKLKRKMEKEQQNTEMNDSMKFVDLFMGLFIRMVWHSTVSNKKIDYVPREVNSWNSPTTFRFSFSLCFFLSIHCKNSLLNSSIGRHLFITDLKQRLLWLPFNYW